MPKFLIEIDSEADLKAIKAYREELNKQVEATRKAGGETEQMEKKLKRVDTALEKAAKSSKDFQDNAATEKTTGRVDRLTKALRQAGGAGGSMADLIERGMAAIKSPIGLATAAVVGLVGAFKAATRSITLYADKEDAIRGLNQALANQGALTEAVARKYRELADDMERATNVDSTEWLEAFNVLTQGGAGAQNIELHVNALKNLAGMMGGDVVGASRKLTKAIQGQFDEFSEFGIVIDKTMSQGEALKTLYKELSEQGSGQLEARTKSLKGEIEQAAKAVKKFAEQVGSAVGQSRAFKFVLDQVVTVFGYWADILKKLFPEMDSLDARLKKQKASALEAAEASRKFAAQLAEEASAFEAAALAADRYRQELHSAARAQAELEDIALAERLAEIDEKEQAGQLTGSQATLERAQARRESSHRQTNILNARDRAIIQQYEEQIQTARQAVGSLSTQLSGRQQLLRGVQDREAAQGEIERLEESQKILLEEVGKLQEALENKGDLIQPTHGLNRFSEDELNQFISSAQRRLAKINEAIADRERRIGAATPGGTVEDERRTVHELSKRLKVAEQRLGELLQNQSQIDQLRGDIEHRTTITTRENYVTDRTARNRAEQQRQQELRDRQLAALDAAASQAATPGEREAIERMRGQLDTDGRQFQAVGNQLLESLRQSGATNIGVLNRLLAEQRRQAQLIQRMEAQMRNSRVR